MGNPLDPVARILAAVCTRKPPRTARILASLVGGGFFLSLFPWLLSLAARPLARFLPLSLPRLAEAILGGIAAASGLAILLWAIVTFWREGGGTPAPVAAPQRLVTRGPFAWCRNPILLSACAFYFGLGWLAFSLSVALLMLVLGLLVGVPYHRFVEERELRLRFGDAYEEYRRHVPFLIPRRPR